MQAARQNPLPDVRNWRSFGNGTRLFCLVLAVVLFAAVPSGYAQKRTVRTKVKVASAKKSPKKPAKTPPRKARKAQLKSKLQTVRGKIKTTQTKLRDAKRSEEAIAAELAEIQGRLKKTRNELAAAKNRLTRTRKEQAKVNAALVASQKRLRDREIVLARRMAANYRQGPVRYFSVILGSRSMREMVSRAQVVRAIVRYDARLVAAIKADREEVLRWKRQADEKAREVAQLLLELGARQDAEAKDTIRQRQVLAEARALRTQLEKELRALEADSSQIAARLQALEFTPAGIARRAIAFRGGFIRPVPGPVVSRYGMRFHPILKYKRLHAGVDFGSGSGTPIVAAASGTVVFSGRMGGYGNVVVVDHGGGISTLYAHCSARLVREGQAVTQGQTIARVGATGLATGPHLHFEVRKNGSPINPGL
jgi:murein DD-endopeptidase MepM/ murein hydrolase activator NlpD